MVYKNVEWNEGLMIRKDTRIYYLLEAMNGHSIQTYEVAYGSIKQMKPQVSGEPAPLKYRDIENCRKIVTDTVNDFNKKIKKLTTDKKLTLKCNPKNQSINIVTT